MPHSSRDPAAVVVPDDTLHRLSSKPAPYGYRRFTTPSGVKPPLHASSQRVDDRTVVESTANAPVSTPPHSRLPAHAQYAEASQKPTQTCGWSPHSEPLHSSGSSKHSASGAPGTVLSHVLGGKASAGAPAETNSAY